jgi:cytoskeletal protein RodZ
VSEDAAAVEHEAEHQADVRRATTRKATIRAQAGLTLLIGLVTLIVLGSLGALVYQTVIIRDNQLRTKALVQAQQQQQRDVKAILARNARTDANRSALIDAAVQRIAEAQRKALAEHDDRVEALLLRTLALTNAEVNAPSNREAAMPPPMTRQGAVASSPVLLPRTAPTAPRAPAPPAVAPCVTAGKSDRCRK